MQIICLIIMLFSISFLSWQISISQIDFKYLYLFVQRAILVAIGLQRKGIDDLEKELSLPSSLPAPAGIFADELTELISLRQLTSNTVKRSATDILKRLAILSRVSNEGAFLPRSIRLRKSTETSSASANCSWVAVAPESPAVAFRISA